MFNAIALTVLLMFNCFSPCGFLPILNLEVKIYDLLYLIQFTLYSFILYVTKRKSCVSVLLFRAAKEISYQDQTSSIIVQNLNVIQQQCAK